MRDSYSNIGLAMLKAQGKPVKELARLYSPIPRETIEKVIEYEDFRDKTIA